MVWYKWDGWSNNVTLQCVTLTSQGSQGSHQSGQAEHCSTPIVHFNVHQLSASVFQAATVKFHPPLVSQEENQPKKRASQVTAALSASLKVHQLAMETQQWASAAVEYNDRRSEDISTTTGISQNTPDALTLNTSILFYFLGQTVSPRCASHLSYGVSVSVGDNQADARGGGDPSLQPQWNNWSV